MIYHSAQSIKAECHPDAILDLKAAVECKGYVSGARVGSNS